MVSSAVVGDEHRCAVTTAWMVRFSSLRLKRMTSRQFDETCREVEAELLQQLRVDEEVRSTLG